MNNIQIQIQNISGTWFTINTVKNLDTTINNALTSAVKSFKKRARAVDSSGNVVDIRNE